MTNMRFKSKYEENAKFAPNDGTNKGNPKSRQERQLTAALEGSDAPLVLCTGTSSDNDVTGCTARFPMSCTYCSWFVSV